MCGYNCLSISANFSALGSSPRVRVQLLEILVLWAAARIIPACAGTTSLHASQILLDRDHPRVCGYNSKKSHNFSDSILYRFCFPISLISFLIIYHHNYFFILFTNFSIFKANSNSNFASSNAL